MGSATSRRRSVRGDDPAVCLACGGALTRFTSVSHRDDHVVCFNRGCARYGEKVGGLTRVDIVLSLARRLLESNSTTEQVRAAFVTQMTHARTATSQHYLRLTPSGPELVTRPTSAFEVDRVMDAWNAPAWFGREVRGLFRDATAAGSSRLPAQSAVRHLAIHYMSDQGGALLSLEGAAKRYRAAGFDSLPEHWRRRHKPILAALERDFGPLP